MSITHMESSDVLADAHLRKKMMACWRGKAVGGTLGLPYEGVQHTLDLTFYDPVPTEMLPNDDLDLQVIYAYLLNRMDRPRVDRNLLAEAWSHMGLPVDEYGIVMRNLELGLRPPVTGSYDNPFADGLGAAIRTELWACLAAGDPDLAVRFAYEDACMDHSGEGIYAAQLLAALQALAFVCTDREELLDRALSYIPSGARLSAALRDTREWWKELGDWKRVQQRLADRYLTDNFTDVVINLSYVVLGWLAGGGVFGQSICIAVNCGQDTDCTGATLGALLGILDPDGIDGRWLAPIGDSLVLSACVTGVQHPSSLARFTDLVLDLRRRLDTRTPPQQQTDVPVDTERLAIQARVAGLTQMPAKAGGAPFLPADARTIAFPGNFAVLAAEEIPDEVVLVEYEIHMNRRCRAELMFSTDRPVRVWLDDHLVIETSGGRFIPAFHRCGSCWTMVDLEVGTHRIKAAIQRPAPRFPLRWVVGLADDTPRRAERRWLVDAFRHGWRRALCTPS